MIHRSKVLRTNTRYLIILGLFVAFFSAASSADVEAKQPTPLTAMFAWWNEAFQTPGAFNRAGFGRFFTEDATIVINGVVRAQGIDGLVKHFQRIQREADFVEIELPFIEEFVSADGSKIFTHHYNQSNWNGEKSRVVLMGYATVTNGKLSHLNFVSADKELH